MLYKRKDFKGEGATSQGTILRDPGPRLLAREKKNEAGRTYKI